MRMIKVVFVLVMVLPGKEPTIFEQPIDSLEKCLFEVHEFAAKPAHKLLIEGGDVSVGCTIHYDKSVEH